MRSRGLWIAAATLSVLLASTSGWHAAAARELRLWTDSTGKHKIDAEFVSYARGDVRLRRRDGRETVLPLAKLSKADQKFVRERVRSGQAGQTADEAENPFDAGLQSANRSEDRASTPRGALGPLGLRAGDRVEVRQGSRWRPGKVVRLNSRAGGGFIEVLLDGERDPQTTIPTEFFVRPMRQGGSGAAKLGTADEESGDLVDEADMSAVRRIEPSREKLAPFRPDPAPTPVDANKLRPIQLNAISSSFERPAALSIAASDAGVCVVASVALVESEHGPPPEFLREANRMAASMGARFGEEASTIEVCNLTSGACGPRMRGPDNLKLLDVSPSGRRLLTTAGDELMGAKAVQAWNLGDQKLTPIKSWRADADDMGMGVTWLGWLDDERAFTLGGDRLIQWEVDKARAVFEIAASPVGTAVFSPGRRQIALVVQTGVDVHDAATGELLTQVSVDGLGHNCRLAFSSSGKLLAVCGSEKTSIFDLTTQRMLMTAHSPHAKPFARSLLWVGDEYVLVSGSDLISLRDQVVIWTYKHDAELVVPMGAQVGYVLDDRATKRRQVLTLTLPHDAAAKSDGGQLALKPGDPVSLEMERVVDLTRNVDAQHESASEYLTEAIEKAGYRVVDEAPNQLVARTAPGKTQEMHYQSIGPGGETQSMQVTGRIYELELVVDGQVVWSRKNFQLPPHHLHRKGGESIEQAVNRVMEPNPSYFGGSIPSRVPAAAETAKRTSTISFKGIQ